VTKFLLKRFYLLTLQNTPHPKDTVLSMLIIDFKCAQLKTQANVLHHCCNKCL